jgi:hypothetical protein
MGRTWKDSKGSTKSIRDLKKVKFTKEKKVEKSKFGKAEEYE